MKFSQKKKAEENIIKKIFIKLLQEQLDLQEIIEILQEQLEQKKDMKII